LINEIQRAEELLNGRKFNDSYFFSAYCVLIRYYKYHGLSKDKTKENILEWENKFCYDRYFDLTNAIDRVYDINDEFKKDVRVNISKKDIEEINFRFDSINMKKIAFAMLCYAKVKANKDGVFYINFGELSEWIYISSNNIHSRYMKDLEQWGYIEKLPSEKNIYSWNKDNSKKFYSRSKIKIKVDFDNNCDADWVLNNNDILDLFYKIFPRKVRKDINIKDLVKHSATTNDYNEAIINREVEIWKTIENTKGKYQISSFGNVRLVYGVNSFKNLKIKYNYTYTKEPNDYNGYAHISIRFDEFGSKVIGIHRLVAAMFIPNPNNYNVVNHKDGNKLNNHVENLEWCTQKENIQHAINTGLRKGNLKPIIITEIKSGERFEFKSISEAEKLLGMKNISQILRRKNNRTKDYIFEYKENA
jgi:hypothetical protein